MAPEKITTIYAYRLTVDSGGAPCTQDLGGRPTGLLTLACCKGGWIRKDGREVRTGMRHTIGEKHTAEISSGAADVYVMGIYKTELLYFARITEILRMEDYYAPDSRFGNRLDSIYRFADGKFTRNDNNPEFHSKEKTCLHKKDWLGEYVLLSDCFAYFGRESPSLPADLLKKLTRYKRFERDTSDVAHILKTVGSLWDFKTCIQNRPHDPKRYCVEKGC
jgi:hypothetical protein